MPLRTTPKRRFLRGGHDHAAVQRHGLAKGKLRIAGARRQIHEQEIEITPIDSADELLDGLHDHRAAPDDRLITFDQKSHAHQLHAMILRRDHLFLLADNGALVDTHHQRNAGTVDVAIQQAYPRARDDEARRPD